VIDPNKTINEIMARAKTLTGMDVFEGGVPDAWQPSMIPGTTQIRPYVVLDFAGISEAPKGNQGIVGADMDGYVQQFSTHSVASTKASARATNTAVLKKLLGFEPTNCGEIRPAFFAGIGESSTLADPARYSAAQAYRFIMNP
jgi:hypothetical protein